MSQLQESYQGLDLDDISKITGLISTYYNHSVLSIKNQPKGEACFDQMDQFRGLGLNELRRLGLSLLTCQNIFEAYDLLAQTPTDGELTYYDRIIGPQHNQAYSTMEAGLADLEPVKVESGLDLATGTGVAALILSNHCRNVAAIDLSPAMLVVADRRLKALVHAGKLDSYQTRVMDCTSLGFPDSSFDVVTEQAVSPYLTDQEHLAYFQEVYRVLKPGGRLYQYHEDMEHYRKRAFFTYSQSSRALLAACSSAALLSFGARIAYKDRATPSPLGVGFQAKLFSFLGESPCSLLQLVKPSSNP